MAGSAEVHDRQVDLDAVDVWPDSVQMNGERLSILLPTPRASTQGSLNETYE